MFLRLDLQSKQLQSRREQRRTRGRDHKRPRDQRQLQHLSSLYMCYDMVWGTHFEECLVCHYGEETRGLQLRSTQDMDRAHQCSEVRRTDSNWSVGSNAKLGIGPELPSYSLSGRLLGSDWRGMILGPLGCDARAARPGNAAAV
jgi:hypothetical protein